MKQTELIKDYLEKNGSITDFEAFTKLGIRRLSARIWDLKHKEKVPISSELIKVKTAHGEATVAKYTLLKEIA